MIRRPQQTRSGTVRFPVAGVLSRSEQMSRVRQRDTGPEMKLRRALWATGLRYKVTPDLPGRPDMAFTGSRLAVFVDGCFWHGCPAHYSRPKTRCNFWDQKLARNVARDLRVDSELRERRWRTIHVWEHELKDLAAATARVAHALDLKPERRPAPVSAAIPWWRCRCGSDDCQIQVVEGVGGLSVTARSRLTAATVACRECGAITRRLVR